MNMLYNAWIKIDNRRKKRRRKQVKRCSSANLSLERTSALTLIHRSIAVKSKWNHGCMQKEMMYICI